MEMHGCWCMPAVHGTKTSTERSKPSSSSTRPMFVQTSWQIIQRPARIATPQHGWREQ